MSDFGIDLMAKAISKESLTECSIKERGKTILTSIYLTWNTQYPCNQQWAGKGINYQTLYES